MSHQFTIPPDPDLIFKHLGSIVRETVLIEGRSFLIDRPAESDRLQNHPAVRAALAQEYIPYWADLWPAARMLAKAILHEPWTPGTPALEIGCGLGLGGIVALSMGLSVTFSDHDVCALRFAADNARLNGFADVRTLQVDWREPTPDLRFPIILGSDLLYDGKIVAPLVAFLNRTLAPGGVCLITDQDRIPSQMFKQQLMDEGWSFTATMMRAGEPKRGRAKGTLYRITRPQ